MKPIINHLMQLQELVLIRDEEKVVTGGKHLENVDAAIADLTAQLPRDVRSMFERLHKKDHVVIVPTAEGVCAGCGMRLPISLVQAVQQRKRINTCPNCARILCYTGEGPRRKGRPPRRTEARKVGIQRFSSPNLMIPSLQSDDTEEVIAELAHHMEACGFVDKADQLVEAALQREAVSSTALGHGLAFPHVRGVEGGGLSLALGLKKKGLRFAHDSKQLTRIVFFIVIPMAASAFYLKLLAGLSETFAKTEARKTLLAEKEPEALWKTLCKLTRTTVK
jgi:mannitol/fructose-specific phosphotransferase system IIA component (Ntr-type)